MERNSTRQQTNLWKATPTSVSRTSRFFPLKHSLAPSPTFSNNSQHATHGSVLTRANERSSFRGAKSFFFCLDSWAESQVTIAGQQLAKSSRKPAGKWERTIDHPLQKRIRSALDPTDRLVIEHYHVSPDCDRRAGQWENCVRHILLPEVADEVGQTQDL